MKKRLFSFLLFLCLAAVSISTASCTANAKNSADTMKYIAFGDSIAAGYGLDGYSPAQTSAPAGSYQALAGNFLKTGSCNYAVSGSDSDDCIELLSSGAADADLKTADVVSLTIGSNDLLKPFLQIVMDFYGIDPENMNPSDYAQKLTMPQFDASAMMEYYRQAQELLAKLADNVLLHEKAQAFPEKLRTILSILREKAPDAEIYVTNIYNPFYFVPLLKNLSQTYITEINQAFSADDPDYTLIDVYTAFQQQELTNVRLDMSNPSAANVDPHPSADGHKVISELFIQALNDAHAPKAAALTSAASSKKHKLTAVIKLPDSADSCRLLYAASKNGNYKTLAAVSGKTYRTNSEKLKAGKVYYIKAQSIRTIKGVTYYGKASGAKKVKIAG